MTAYVSRPYITQQGGLFMIYSSKTQSLHGDSLIMPYKVVLPPKSNDVAVTHSSLPPNEST
jgi:hypothetical protein